MPGLDCESGQRVDADFEWHMPSVDLVPGLCLEARDFTVWPILTLVSRDVTLSPANASLAGFAVSAGLAGAWIVEGGLGPKSASRTWTRVWMRHLKLICRQWTWCPDCRYEPVGQWAGGL